MTELGDSYGPKPPTTVRAAGYAGMLRYLSHQAGKCVTAGEVAAYRSAGLLVGLVFEDGAAAAARGHDQGVADGQFAAATARQVGYPAGAVIFAAVDFEATDMAPIIDYFRGFAAGATGYQTGPYGSAAVVDAVAGAGVARWAWQTAAWSAGRVSAHADLYQHAFGAVFDSNELLRPVPLWGTDPIAAPPTSPAAPAAPDTHHQEDLMFYVRSTGHGGRPGHRIRTGDVFVLTGGRRVYVATKDQLAFYTREFGHGPVDAAPELIARWAPA